MRRTTLEIERPCRESGTVLAFTMLVLLLMTGLTTALFLVTFEDTKQSAFYSDRGELLQYAQDGVSLALMEINYGTGGGDGKIGTELWTVASDLGRDGKPLTKDEGEGDGIPTPGEPLLSPSSIGPAAGGIRLLVRSEDTAWTGTKRIVSVAYKGQSVVALEAYGGGGSVPLSIGAIYVPGTALFTLSGTNYTSTGIDTNPDNTAGPAPATWAVTTPIGTPAGANKTLLSSQLNSAGKNFTGLDGGLKGKASVSEVTDPSFETLFNTFKTSAGVVNLAGGSYTKDPIVLGDYTKNQNQITYVKGDVQFSAGMTGAGVLLVDGNLKMSGQAIFAGLIMVRGDCELSGGGNGVHLYGGLMVQNPLPPTQIKLTGNSHVDYSSNGLKWEKGLTGGKMGVKFWNQLK